MIRLADLRAAVKAVDPEATVSTRSLVHGAFAVRTREDEPVRARLLALGFEEVVEADIEGSSFDWIHVLYVQLNEKARANMQRAWLRSTETAWR